MNNPKIQNIFLSLLSILILGTISCEKTPPSSPSTQPASPNEGVYILNQGSFGNSDASLDYYDFSTDSIYRNRFASANPEVPLGLGDVGNDLGIYGSKMYIVMNNSNKIEVVDAHSVKRMKKIDLNQPRYIVFSQGKAYVSTYDNFVAVIDTGSLRIEDSIPVGNTPEQMAIVGNKLYVTNSGGLDFPHYDSTLSVVDLATGTTITKITVGTNPTNIIADDNGKAYVITAGNYDDVPADLYSINTKADTVTKDFHVGATNMALFNNKLFVYQNEYNANSQGYENSYTLIDTKTDKIAGHHFVSDDVENQIIYPFGLAVQPDNGHIIITSARDFSSPGTLYYLDAEGNILTTIKTGINPSSFAFLK